MTEVTVGQISGQNTVKTALIVKYKNRSHLFDLFLNERTGETTKFIHLWSLLKQTKTRVRG